MSSLLACNAKHGFLYLAYQHKEVTRMTFAEKLKSIRKKAGLSQEQLAEKLGVSRQAATKWETETGSAEHENMKAIAATDSDTILTLAASDLA